MYPFLLDENYILGLIGYFFLAIAGVALVIMLLIGRVVFSTDKKTTFGKISRVVYLAAGGVVLLIMAALLYA